MEGADTGVAGGRGASGTPGRVVRQRRFTWNVAAAVVGAVLGWSIIGWDIPATNSGDVAGSLRAVLSPSSTTQQDRGLRPRQGATAQHRTPSEDSAHGDDRAPTVDLPPPDPQPTTRPAPTSPAPTNPAPTAGRTPTTGRGPTATRAPRRPPAAGSSHGYHLVFSDDFDSLDRSKWNVRNDTYASNEESIDTARPQNVFVSDGALTLRAIKESYTVGNTTRQYTSGYLDSIGKGSWRYGRFEMRAKLPAAQGMWPAFWLRENTGLGEIDVMEAVGGLDDRSVQTVHQSTNGGEGRAGHENRLSDGSSNTDWHTYTLEREPGFVKWWVDGRLVFVKTVTDLSWLDSTFDEPMNIRLNLQVGGSMPSYYDKPVVGAPAGRSDFVVDWVRVYQRS